MPGLSDPAGLRAALPGLFAGVAGRGAIGLAVSGGGDSLALLLLAAEWARKCQSPPRLIVYSVDHGLRPEAAGEVAFVQEVAARFGLPAKGLRWDGPWPASGVQAAARAARYRLIGAAMAADGAEILLTGHHLADQAETVLMRLAHGSGLGGLRGMEALSEVESVPVFRPFLGVSPESLRAVVAEAGLVPVLDPSNENRHYERVKWRQILPKLGEVGLGFGEIAALARRAGEADAALAECAQTAFAELVTMDPLGAAAVPAEKLLGLPRAVGVKLLGRLVDLTGGGTAHELGALERLHDRLATGAPLGGVTLLGAAVRQRGGVVWFSREAGRAPPGAARLEPKATLLWDRRFRIANGSPAAVEVRMAGGLTRAAAERLLGRKLAAPAAAIRTAPLVSGADGAVLALGAHRLAAGISVDLAAAAPSIFAS